MKTVYVVSLSKHRIDEMLADLIEIALSKVGITVKRELPNDNVRVATALLIVTNGVMDYASDWCINVVRAMDKYDTLYFCDDITTYVPKAHITIVSQFQDFSKVHPDAKNKVEYWQISKLGSFLHSLPWIPKDIANKSKEYNFVYWGHFKPSRLDKYVKYIQNKSTTLIIGNKSEWPLRFNKCTYLPYERDMANLYTLIAKGSKTAIFGDDIHNAAGNTPLRIYEAILCNVDFIIDKELHAEEQYLLGQSIDDIGAELLILFSLTYNITINNITNVVQDKIKKPNTQLAHTDTDTTSILAKRASIYGTYIGGVECRASILNALNIKHKECNGVDLSTNLVVMFSDLALKMMRIASDPTHLDSYIDLEGYARIIKEAQINGSK